MLLDYFKTQGIIRVLVLFWKNSKIFHIIVKQVEEIILGRSFLDGPQVILRHLSVFPMDCLQGRALYDSSLLQVFLIW